MFVRVLGSVDIEVCGRAQQVAVIRPMTGRWARGEVLELVQPDGSQPPTDTRAYSVAALTRREREVLTCVGRAYDNREIAEELVIAVRTVNRHLENIRGKLGSRRRSELVRIARQIDPEWAQRPELTDSASDNASDPSRNIGAGQGDGSDDAFERVRTCLPGMPTVVDLEQTGHRPVGQRRPTPRLPARPDCWASSVNTRRGDFG